MGRLAGEGLIRARADARGEQPRIVDRIIARLEEQVEARRCYTEAHPEGQLLSRLRPAWPR